MGNGIDKTGKTFTTTTLRRPTVGKADSHGNAKVTYYDGKQWQTTKVNPIGVYLAQGIHDLAFKDKSKNHGSITQKDALALLQKTYENVNYKSGGDCAGYYTGYLSDIKNMFGLYTDNASEGGGKITQQEQSQIMRTIANWFKAE